MKQTFTSFLFLFFSCTFLQAQSYEVRIKEWRCTYQVQGGRLHGLYRSYYPNGCTRAEGRFRHNLRDSTWVVYDTTGEVIAKRKYENAIACSSFAGRHAALAKTDSVPNRKTTGLLDEVYVNEHMPRHKCVPYTYLQQPDLLWNKRVWRFIGQEKFNVYLFNRNRLVEALFDGLTNHTLQAWKDQDGEWGEPVQFNGLDTTLYSFIGFRIKEDWYFDRARSIMDVQIQGLAPAVRHQTTGDTLSLCWFYFPDLVPLLSETKSYSRHSNPASLYDVFYRRMFNSQVYQQSSVFDQRCYQVPARERNPATEKFILEKTEEEHDRWTLSH